MVVVALIGISFAADWTVLRLFESRPSQLAFLGAQGVNATFLGLSYAVAVTFLIPKERKRIRFSFALLWISFTTILFIVAVRLPIPLWQSVAMKIALIIIAARILWITRNRWKAVLSPPAPTEEHSHA
jgi:hypothetical protein